MDPSASAALTERGCTQVIFYDFWDSPIPNAPVVGYAEEEAYILKIVSGIVHR